MTANSTQHSTTNKKQSDHKANQPADPHIAPMVLVTIDARERVDQRETEKAENEQRSKKWSTAQVDHEVDVTLKTCCLHSNALIVDTH